MKKWLKRAGISVAALLVMMICGIWFLLGSESGTRFIVSQLEKQMDGQLQVGTAEGRLLDRLELRDVVFNFPFGRGKFSRFVLDWKTTDLLRLHLHLLEIAADDVSYTALPTESEPSTEPFVLPDLSLPIKISLEKLAVANVQFFSAPKASPVVVNSASLALLWDEKGIQLHDLQVYMPEGTAAVQGKLNPVAHYPLKLQADIVSLMTDLPSIKLHGDFSGDLQTLLVQLAVQGDISAKLDATVNDVIDKLSWQAKLVVSDLRPALFAPDIPGMLTGKIETKGNLQQASATALLEMRDQESADYNWNADLDLKADLQDLLFTVNRLRLSHAQTDAVLDLSGTASVDQELDLQLNLHNLQWPVLGTPDFAVPVAEISLKGTVEDYLLNLTADLGGGQLPDGSWLLKAKGSTERAEIMELQGNVLEGTLALSGNVQWSPQVEWNLKSQAKGINPEELSEEWPGKFDWLLQSEGKLEEKGVSAEVSLESLKGTLREQALFGSAELSVSPDSIDIRKLQLGSGSAEIAVKGILGENSEIDWNLDVPALGDLLPHAAGTVHGSGTVKGAMREPRLTVELTADSALFAGAELKRLQLGADVDLSWQNPFTVKLSAQGLQYEGNGVEDLQLSGEGSLEKHRVQLSAVHELASLKLSLAGGYDKVWQGVVKTFAVDSKDLGVWRLRDAVNLTAGPDAAQLEKMCLEGEGKLCLGGSWNRKSGQSKADVLLNGFALASLSPWFPEALQDVGGIFSLQAAVDMQEKLQADVTAEITPGEIRYKTDTELLNTVRHEGGKLTVHVAEDAVDAAFRFSLEGNELKGEATLPDILKVEEKGDAAITARLFVNAHKFDVLEAMLTDLQELDAGIDMDFTVNGTLKEPGISGKGNLDIANVFIPAAGLELKDTIFTIVAADKEVSLNGTFHSPEGSLTLSGNAQLDAAKNWPAKVSLQADTFRLVNLPEIKVFLDSDLTFEKQGEQSLLSGSIAIPKAAILIRELGKGSQDVSPDVVIIQEQKEEPEEVTSPFKMDLKVSLGNDVHFAGFGLNAFVNGQLLLTANPEEQLLGSGEFHIKQGTYRAYGQDLDIERGVISFPGGPLSQPGINLRATRTVGDIVAGVNVLGPALTPRITTFSRPPMSESSTISYLLTGSAPEGGHGGVKLSVGRQINNKLSVFVGTDMKTGDSEFGARYRLNRKIYVQTTTATNSNAVDLFYTIEVGGVDELVTEVVTKDLKMNILKKNEEKEKQ